MNRTETRPTARYRAVPHVRGDEPIDVSTAQLAKSCSPRAWGWVVPENTTLPDFHFEDPNGIKDGICIYLDGMSEGLHGRPETAQRDRIIREELRSRNYEVIEITRGQLDDREAMVRHFRRLGRILVGRDRTEEAIESLDGL